MKLIMFSTIIAVVSAAQLPTSNYLPPRQGASSGNRYLPPNHGQGSFAAGGGSQLAGDTGNKRSQQAVEKNAAILQQTQEIDEGGFRYSYETSNGIRAEEAGDTSHSHGGFAYKGDDGNVYSITFSAGEGGFRPEGAHLPVAPPTPKAILLALEQNARDEAAGIFDDGQYHPEQSGQHKLGQGGSGGFFTSSGSGSFNTNTGYNY